jgi:triosephosphate isomerase
MAIVVGNWKMFVETRTDAEELTRLVKKEALRNKGTQIIICPPFPLITSVLTIVGKSRLGVGAQDTSEKEKGAWTGEVSASLLRSLGASSVIIGHSERRAEGETDAVIALKVQAAIRAGLRVILCVGEKERTHGEGEHYGIVRDQLLGVLSGLPSRAAQSIMIAYEPVWAIGASAKRAATPNDAREMVVLIRKHLAQIFGQKSAFATPILYGGSVDEKNAAGFVKDGIADGLLVGRASVSAERFISIIHSTQNT